MINLIDRLRETFDTASYQSETPGAIPGKKPEAEMRADMTFADDDEIPPTTPYGTTTILFTPFSWRNERGKKHFGYLMKGMNGKIYGLETDTGLSMTPSATEKMINELAKNNSGKESFSSGSLPGYWDKSFTFKKLFNVMPRGDEGSFYDDI